MTDDTPAHGCTIGGQPAMPITVGEYNQLVARTAELEAALTRVRALAARIRQGAPWTANADDTAAHILAALDEPAPASVSGPAATQATEAEKTARVFAALHRSAEQDVTRVIDLYERWVKAGPPPIGASLSRWWDERLIELHDAIKEQQ